MKNYTVEVTETLRRKVEVSALDAKEAAKQFVEWTQKVA